MRTFIEIDDLKKKKEIRKESRLSKGTLTHIVPNISTCSGRKLLCMYAYAHICILIYVCIFICYLDLLLLLYCIGIRYQEGIKEKGKKKKANAAGGQPVAWLCGGERV